MSHKPVGDMSLGIDGDRRGPQQYSGRLLHLNDV